MIRTSLLLLALLTTAVASAAEGDHPPDIQRIIDRKKLIVALPKSDQPPFFWHDKTAKKLKGFDIEMARQIAVRLGLGKDGVEFNREATTFNDAVNVVGSGRADLAICKLSATLSRGKRMLFTEPYAILRKGLLLNRLKFARLKRGKNPAEVIRNFSGSIAVIAGSSYEGYAKDMFLEKKGSGAKSKCTIVPKKTWAEAVAAVESGEVDAAFRDELEIKKIFRERPDAALRLQSVVFKDTRDPIAIAVSWKSSHLHKWLQQFLPKHFAEYLRSKKPRISADELLDRYPEIFKKQPKSKKKPKAPEEKKPAPARKPEGSAKKS